MSCTPHVTIFDEDLHAATDANDRPWWLLPALAGIAVGAAIGFALLPHDERPLLPEEVVVHRLNALGVSVQAGDPQFDDVLGSAFPARSFDVAGYGTAEVVFPSFVAGPPVIRVCPSPDQPGSRVYVDGAFVRSVNPPPWVYLVSGQYFVIASNERTATIFATALGVARAPC